MRKVYCTIILSFAMSAVLAQNVAIINGKPLTSKEFMWFYKKNHSGNTNVSYKDLEQYLELYIDFKLKVLDAKEAGMDKDTAYLTEVNDYEQSLNTQKRISKSNPEYLFMINEYREAVLMFNLTEKKIWERAQNEETELLSYYERNKNLYNQSSFEEAKGQVITDYQQKLEQEWTAYLRKRYPVKVNPDEIRKLAKL